MVQTPKRVSQFALDGTYIRTYQSIQEAARAVGGLSGGISKVVNQTELMDDKTGRTYTKKTYKGFKWEFAA